MLSIAPHADGIILAYPLPSLREVGACLVAHGESKIMGLLKGFMSELCPIEKICDKTMRKCACLCSKLIFEQTIIETQL